MKTIKISEATTLQLDWLVAKIEGVTFDHIEHSRCKTKTWLWLARDMDYRYVLYSPTTDWAQGGPILEREGILLRPLRRKEHALDGQWLAMYDGENTGTMVQWVKLKICPRHYLSGPTPLVAAMRCYVATHLGSDEAEVPGEL